MAGEKKLTDTEKLSKGARGQLAKLITQFLLGMAVNLIGLPSETTGIAKIASASALGLHVLVALGLLISAIVIIRQARDTKYVRLAWSGGALIVATIVVGILTIAFNNNWWSYIMAVGFIASFLSYGKLLLQTK